MVLMQGQKRTDTNSDRRGEDKDGLYSPDGTGF